MPRLPELTAAFMSNEQRRIAEDILKSGRETASGPFGPWLRSPEMADRAQKLGEFVRFKTSLPPRLSELAILFTARWWTSQVEWAIHAPIARSAGLSDEVVAAIADWRIPSFRNEDEARLFAFSRELYERGGIRDETYSAAVETLGEKGVVELVGILGYYALIAMTLNVFEVDTPRGESLSCDRIPEPTRWRAD